MAVEALSSMGNELSSWINGTSSQESEERQQLVELFESSVYQSSVLSEIYHESTELISRIISQPEQGRDARIIDRYVAALGYDTYQCEQNRTLFTAFEELGFSSTFLLQNPTFLTFAEDNHWEKMMKYLNWAHFNENGEPVFPMQTARGTKQFEMKSWHEFINLVQTDNEGKVIDLRIVEDGFLIGGPADYYELYPLKNIDTNGRCVVQFVTCCVSTIEIPGMVNYHQAGHNYTQIMIPNEDRDDSRLYSVGFYPRSDEEMGWRPFRTVPGVFKSSDPNGIQVITGGKKALINEYEFFDDSENDLSLYTLLHNHELIGEYYPEFEGIELSDIYKAMLGRHVEEINCYKRSLNELKSKIIADGFVSSLNFPSKVQKAVALTSLFKQDCDAPDYQVVEANCTEVMIRQEIFIRDFMSAQVIEDGHVQVFEGQQVNINKLEISIFDKIVNIASRVFIYTLLLTPLGDLLGRGLAHQDAHGIESNWFTMLQRILDIFFAHFPITPQTVCVYPI